MVEKRLDAKLPSIQMPFEYRTALPFEYRTNGPHLVLLCTGPEIKWSGLVHRTYHITRPFEYQTNRHPNFKKFGIQKFSVLKWSVFRFPWCALLAEGAISMASHKRLLNLRDAGYKAKIDLQTAYMKWPLLQ